MKGLRAKIQEDWRWLLVLGVLVVGVYGLSLGNGFVWDDHFFIEGVNKHSALTLNNILRSEYPIPGTGVYRPVRDLIYPVAFLGCGFSPACYHGVILGFNLLVTILIFWLGTEVTNDKRAALLGASLFAVHPVHVEAVAWITAGFDLISAVFYMSCLYLFALAVKVKKQTISRFMKWSWLAAGLAMLSNELALTLPLVIMAYDWLVAGNDPRKRGETYLPYWALSGLYVVARLTLGVAAVTYTRPYQSLVQTGLLSVLILGKYLQLMVWPVKMTLDRVLAPGLTGLFGIDHDPLKTVPGLGLGSQEMLMAVVSVGLVIGGIIWGLKKNRRLAFGLGWLVMGLIPVLQLTPLKVLFAERYGYFASMGGAIAVMAGVSPLLKQKKWLQTLTVVGVVTVVGWGGVAVKRVGDWKDDRSLWIQTLKNNPMSAEANNSLAAVYMAEGNYQAALPYSEKAAELSPAVQQHQINLINVYQELGRYDKMIVFMERMLAREPENVNLIFSIAQVYEEKLDDPVKAHEYYAKAAVYAPNLPMIKEALERTKKEK